MSSNASSSPFTYSDDWITLLESGTTIENGTTGLRTWSASFALAEYLRKHSDILDARVLELGSGCGFLGIITAKLQTGYQDSKLGFPSEKQVPLSLSLSDVNKDVLRRCQDNLALPCNSLKDHPDLSCSLLDWLDVLDTSLKDRAETFLKSVDPDVIIGADLVYDIEIIPALVGTLAIALNQPIRPGRPDRISYLALTVRNEDTVDMFRRAAGEVLEIREEVLNERCSLLMNESLEGKHGWPVRLFVLTSKSGKRDGS